MSVALSSIAEELALFADLGTAPPKPRKEGDRTSFRLFRNGEELELLFHGNGAGKVTERSLDSARIRTHASYRAMLAAETFGNLRQWSDHQKRSMRDVLHDEDEIKVKGVLHDGGEPMNCRELDDFLVLHDQGHHSVQIMLIDGPAGIGKTRFIETLAAMRVDKFRVTQRPLILHIQSRGRVLTYLQDLIAFSVQRLRLSVTFDQVPVLVRHGLVTLAIDGFDELADPNGYELAWSQVNELVEQVRGQGALILAGRETFTGHERLVKNIKSLGADDLVSTFSLQPPHPETARNWLRKRDWTNENLDSVEELFEPGSYALRPFFLVQLADPNVVATIAQEAIGNPLAFLVTLMVKREAGKFGEAIDSVLTEKQRRIYVKRLLSEIARYMADDQTEAIEDRVLQWLVDVTMDEVLPDEGANPEVVAILRNRASFMAFLENDDAPNYRRFAHAQVLNHFLGEVTLDAVSRGDRPKYVRRNILGADYLAAFSDLVMHVAGSNPMRVQVFFQAATAMTKEYAGNDRSAWNLGACLLTMLPAMEGAESVRVEKLEVDEAILRGTIPPAEIHEVKVNQLDIRGADLQTLSFSTSTSVGTLVVDETSRVSPSCPVPVRLQSEGSGPQHSQVVFDPKLIEGWLDSHGKSQGTGQEDSSLVPRDLRNHGLLKLLSRACRSKSYWIPQVADSHFDRFARDPHWPVVLEILEQHELVRTVNKPVSGRNSTFFHVKRPMDILRAREDDDEIRAFYVSLVERIRELEPGL